jgi:hypothetical protein
MTMHGEQSGWLQKIFQKWVIGVILPFVKSDTIGHVSGFLRPNLTELECWREVQMAENEQLYISALVPECISF